MPTLAPACYGVQFGRNVWLVGHSHPVAGSARSDTGRCPSRPSSRHSDSHRPLPLGALRGVPAEGVGRDQQTRQQGKVFPCWSCVCGMPGAAAALSGASRMVEAARGKVYKRSMPKPFDILDQLGKFGVERGAASYYFSKYPHILLLLLTTCILFY